MFVQYLILNLVSNKLAQITDSNGLIHVIMKKLLLFLSVFCILTSCKKDDDILKSTVAKNNKDLQTEGTYQTTPYIDWVNQNSFPLQEVNVLFPWIFGANALQVPYSIAIDHKPVDGWVLLYNRLNDSYPYLMLYNKYRGIIKVFYYHTAAHNTNALSFAIIFGGNKKTSLLNFNTDFAKPMQDKGLINMVENLQVSQGGPTGVSPNNWYYTEFNIAYDDVVKGLSDLDSRMAIAAWGQDKSTITLTGDILGTIKGEITTASNTSSLLSVGNVDLGNKNTTTNAIIAISGVAAAEGGLLKQAAKQTNKKVGEAIGNAAGELATKGLSVISKPLMDLFNSFVGGDLAGKQTSAVNLDMNATVNLGGTLVRDRPIFGGEVPIPGAVHNGAGGVLPYYDKPLGVWNIDVQPTVKWGEYVYKTSTLNALKYQQGTFYVQNYQLDESSFNVKINPDILQDVEVVSIEKKLYYYYNYTGKTNLKFPYRYMSEAPTFVYPVSNSYTLVNSDPDNTWYEVKDHYVRYGSIVRFSPDLSDYDRLLYAAQGNRNYPDLGIVLKIKVTLKNKASGELIESCRAFQVKFVKNQVNNSCLYSDLNPSSGGNDAMFRYALNNIP